MQRQYGIDSHLKQDIDRLERIQRQAARFVTRNYKTRSPGCVTTMLNNLNLPPLEERRKQQRLGLLLKIIDGQIPAMPPEDFLIPAASGRRKIKPTKFAGFSSNNIIERQAVNNSRGFKVPTSNTDQHKYSFFARTVLEWNHLADNDIPAGPTSAASTAPGGLPSRPAPTTK